MEAQVSKRKAATQTARATSQQRSGARAKSSDTAAEARVLEACARLLDDLGSTDSRKLVVLWLVTKYAPGGAHEHSVTGRSYVPAATDHSADRNQEGGEVLFQAFADLFDAAGPTTERERALVAGYWQQFGVEPCADFVAQAANAELKNVGSSLSNITRALDELRSTRPALVVQVSKSGARKQGRKKYKLTVPGKRLVERMIRGEHDETNG